MLLLDGQKLLVRGATYSPTPIGKDMSSPIASMRVEDFFVPAMADVWQRDLRLAKSMGMNALRVYQLRGSGDHSAFLDMAYALNITIFAGFPLDESMHLANWGPSTATLNPLDVNLADVKVLLQKAVQHNRHPAVGMWLVGNEINLEENRFLCEEDCRFDDDTVFAYQALDQLCEVVELEGYLCTSPLADVPLHGYAQEGELTEFVSHVRLLDSICSHFHVWMVRALPAPRHPT